MAFVMETFCLNNNSVLLSKGISCLTTTMAGNTEKEKNTVLPNTFVSLRSTTESDESLTSTESKSFKSSESVISNGSEYLTQQNTILINLLNFYKDESALLKVLKIINGKSKISLRIIDWFVTNFAKQYFTRYNLYDASGNLHFFKVHNEYQCFLDSYKKERFDPFCRWERVFFPYQGDAYIETTIGQLKFFKWAIEKKIIEFVEEHYTEIEADMNARNSSSKKQKKNHFMNNKEETNVVELKEEESITLTQLDKNNTRTNVQTKKRKKREELSVSATKCLKKEQMEMIIHFN